MPDDHGERRGSTFVFVSIGVTMAGEMEAPELRRGLAR
jgi:hypothetical protein